MMISGSIADQRRCFDNGIDLPELFERGEDGNRPVFEGNSKKAQRDCDPAHVRGIEHADELHGSSLQGASISAEIFPLAAR
jgi:hypothetical protein